ncbi:MAG TPA: D-2-hydroxyacid dehydrogenase family protein [Burkholderiaceae bacterium]|jgi:D-3-phosphoglycerate dehydrogenase
MKITLLDDYQDVVRTFDRYATIAQHDVTVWNDHSDDIDVLAQRLQDTEVLLLIRERTKIGAALLDRLPRLRLISQFGVTPHIDLEACTRRGVVVCSRSAPGQPSYATAELTWGLIIAALRRIPQEVQALKMGRWQSPDSMGLLLRGRTLGVYGFGRIGGVVAGYGRAFGMKVQVWGRPSTLARARADGWDVADSEQAFFETSDVITLHLPLIPATRGIVSANLLGKMKTDALIVNTSRAELIETGALESALRAGRPGLGAVDVFEEEPLLGGAGHPLLALPNLTATPHVGYVERTGLEKMFETIFEQIVAFERGEPINVLNR